MSAPKKAATALRALREFFRSAPVNERMALWDVLSALRGPDDESLYDKGATTAVIRWHVFGRALDDFVIASPDADHRAKCRRAMALGHFKSHARRAFEALGLAWDEVNSEPARRGK